MAIKLFPWHIFLCVFCIGNVLNIQTGEWTGEMSGLGAGQDSFYEYLLKVSKLSEWVIVVYHQLSNFSAENNLIFNEMMNMFALY